MSRDFGGPKPRLSQFWRPNELANHFENKTSTAHFILHHQILRSRHILPMFKKFSASSGYGSASKSWHVSDFFISRLTRLYPDYIVANLLGLFGWQFQPVSKLRFESKARCFDNFFLAVLNKKHKNNFFLQNQWKLRKAIVVKIWVCKKCFLWDQFLTNFEEAIAKNKFSPFSTFWNCLGVRQEPLQPSQPVGDPPPPHQRHSNLGATC